LILAVTAQRLLIDFTKQRVFCKENCRAMCKMKKPQGGVDLAALFVSVTIIVFMGGPGRGVIEFQKIPPYPMATGFSRLLQTICS
jgi:hypothetical protein